MLEKIRRDKWKHFLVGLLMGVVFEWILLWLFPMHTAIVSILVLVLIMAISYGFELTSLLIKRGHYDILDAVAGAAGGLVGIIIILLIR